MRMVRSGSVAGALQASLATPLQRIIASRSEEPGLVGSRRRKVKGSELEPAQKVRSTSMPTGHRSRGSGLPWLSLSMRVQCGWKDQLRDLERSSVRRPDETACDLRCSCELASYLGRAQ